MKSKGFDVNNIFLYWQKSSHDLIVLLNHSVVCMHMFTAQSDQGLFRQTSKLTFALCILPHSAAPTQQCSFGCSSAGRLRDPSPPQNPAQPGDPVRIPGQVRGGCSPLQAGFGRLGEDFWT